MGPLRGIWRSSIAGRTIDTVTNCVMEGSIKDGIKRTIKEDFTEDNPCLLYTSPSPRDGLLSRMPSSA